MALLLPEIERLVTTLRTTPEIVIMDTEQTCWEGSWERRKAGKPLPDELREVIQIGAVRVETAQFTVLDHFEHVVRPKINPVLTPFCIALTGVSQERIDSEGTSFAEGLAAFQRFVGDRPVVVYNADEVVFRENLEINGLDADIPAYFRLRGALEQCGVDMAEVNSGKIAVRLGSTKTYREHDALADVVSMADGLAILAEVADGQRAVPN
jgi:hypothetical protein